VIEEVARVDVSASLIPAVNKLGSMPIILSGSEDVKQKVLRPIAAGQAMISYGLSEREAGSDAGAMKTRARLDGDTWVLNGTKAWITNAGVSDWYTVMAVTDPDKGANGISAFAVHRDDPGFAVGPKERKMGIKGSPTCELYFTDCTIPADRIIGPPGTGFKTRCARWTSPGPPSVPRRWAWRRARSTPRSPTSRTARSSGRRSAPSRACSSCSPTWR
jgi:alkylation response protein AidB-like acyl-CoA dehydrogenase